MSHTVFKLKAPFWSLLCSCVLCKGLWTERWLSFKSTGYSWWGAWFEPQHRQVGHNHSQLQFQGISDLYGHQAHMWHTYIHVGKTHTCKVNLKLKMIKKKTKGTLFFLQHFWVGTHVTAAHFSELRRHLWRFVFIVCLCCWGNSYCILLYTFKDGIGKLPYYSKIP